MQEMNSLGGGVAIKKRICKFTFYGSALMLAATLTIQSALGGDLGPGGLSIGGPGLFAGSANDFQVIHASESPRTLCVTLSADKGINRAYFDQQGDFIVTDGNTSSACADSVTEVAVGCEGDRCESNWRVDTVGGATDISESTCDANQYVSGIDTTGSVVCSSLESYVNANCAIYFGWRDAVDDETTEPLKVGRVRGDGSCTVSGADSNCTAYGDILNDAVTMVGINTDGNVNDNDKFYIGIKCSEPPQ